MTFLEILQGTGEGHRMGKVILKIFSDRKHILTQ